MNVEGPLSASAYELLGVAATVSDDDLRRAYRQRLRMTHPDTGGDAAVFIAVQHAWDLVGTPQARSSYDRGRAAASAALLPRTHTMRGTRPGGRIHGRAGAARRAQYLSLLAAQHGAELSEAQAYSPQTVREAHWGARRMLARALAAEDVAERIDALGIGYTVWHDALTPLQGGTVDHLVLGPRGLFALQSEDFGAPVRIRKGELFGPGVEGEEPITALLTGVRELARAARVRFGGAVLTLPDEHLDEGLSFLGALRSVQVAVVRRSSVRTLLGSGIPGGRAVGGTEAFDVRTRLQHSVRTFEA